MRSCRECLVALLLYLAFALCSAGKKMEDSCGSKEKLVPGGEEVEEICDGLMGLQNCTLRSVSHIRIKTTEKGACHCADGLYRHSNGSCLTLRECGYMADKSPCASHERTVFNEGDRCGVPTESFSLIKIVYCQCPIGQVRLSSSTCISVEECEKEWRGKIYKMKIFVLPEPTTAQLPKIDHCGDKEKLVVGGEPEEQICDVVFDQCKAKSHVEVPQTENGACHCVDGLFRHSNGSCLTLRECGYDFDDRTSKMNTTQSQPSLPRSQDSQLQPKNALPLPQTLSPTRRKQPTSTTKSTTTQLTNTRQQTHVPELNNNTNKINAWIFASAGLGALAVFGTLLVIMWRICKKRSKKAVANRAYYFL